MEGAASAQRVEPRARAGNTCCAPNLNDLVSHMDWITEGERGINISVRVSPNSKQTKIDGFHGERLKIRLHAPPVDGKANKELLLFIAERLGVRKSQCAITQGEASRDKVVSISGIDASSARRALQLP